MTSLVSLVFVISCKKFLIFPYTCLFNIFAVKKFIKLTNDSLLIRSYEQVGRGQVILTACCVIMQLKATPETTLECLSRSVIQDHSWK